MGRVNKTKNTSITVIHRHYVDLKGYLKRINTCFDTGAAADDDSGFLPGWPPLEGAPKWLARQSFVIENNSNPRQKDQAGKCAKSLFRMIIRLSSVLK